MDTHNNNDDDNSNSCIPPPEPKVGWLHTRARKAHIARLSAQPLSSTLACRRRRLSKGGVSPRLRRVLLKKRDACVRLFVMCCAAIVSENLDRSDNRFQRCFRVACLKHIVVSFFHFNFQFRDFFLQKKFQGGLKTSTYTIYEPAVLLLCWLL